MIIKKGQSAIEFAILITGMFFFFIIFIAFLNNFMSEKTYQKKSIAALEIVNALSDEINLAYEAGEGYYREFTLPNTVLNNDYQIQIVQTSIYLVSSDEKHALSLQARNVTGQPIVGINIIRNLNGTVYLN